MVGRLYTSPGFPAGIPEAPLEDADAAKQLVAIPAFHIKSIAMYTSCVVQHYVAPNQMMQFCMQTGPVVELKI